MHEFWLGIYLGALIAGSLSALAGNFDWAFFCVLLAIATKPQIRPKDSE